MIESHRPKIYIYDLPDEYSPSRDLKLVSETYFAIASFFKNYCVEKDPKKAELFFVPINLIQYQFKNENPSEVLKYLTYLHMRPRPDHVIIALGDFSQRSKMNHYGNAYMETYSWIDDFILLALESTSDLKSSQDIGIIPWNTLSEKPKFNSNERMFLYSFYGELNHAMLPKGHIRNKLKNIKFRNDAFIGSSASTKLKIRMLKRYFTLDLYELFSRNSLFTLCPAGYGRWTYRFFQAIQWGSIPVLLSDDYSPPFKESIPYDQFCIIYPEKDISQLDDYLRSIPLKKINELQQNLKQNQRHFTKDNFFNMLSAELMKKINNV